jgi:membrane protein
MPHRRSDRKALAMLLRNPLEVGTHLLWKFWQDECPQRAASLAYTTLLSLVPSLAVAFAMLKAFGGLTPIQERLETLVYTHLVTTSSLQAADYIQKFAERAHAGAIGSVGFLAFIITAVSLLNTVASAFNRVWGVEDRRSLKDRFLTFFTLTVLGPILFGASISITGTILHWQVWAQLPIPGLGPALSLFVPFLLTWAGFLLLYVVIPSAPLRLRPALLGSLAVAASWELVKVGFEWYVTTVTSYGQLYASLSVIPVFLLWLYVGWLIALLGFEVSHFLQHPEAVRRPVGVGSGAMRTAVTPQEAIRTFVAVAEAFVKSGEPVTADRVAMQVQLSEDSALATLYELERQGYVARVVDPADAYLPRRAPATIKVGELWRVLGGHALASDGDALDQLFGRAADATELALGATTVQDLLDAGSPPGAAQTARRSREELRELA